MENSIFFGVWLSGMVTMICSFIIKNNHYQGIAAGIFLALIIQQALEGFR